MANVTARKRMLAALFAIVAVALLSRAYFIETRGGDVPDQVAWAVANYFGGITKGYLLMRDSILAGAIEGRPWSYLPGYPAFMAALYVLGVHDLVHVRMIQSAIDAIAIFPLYFVLVRLSKSIPLALAGCLVYAASPWWSVASTYLLAESLLPALFITLLAVMTRVKETAGTLINWLLLGLLASILPFFRSEMVLLFVFLAMWAFLVAPRHRRALSAIVVSVGFLFPLIVWGVRNGIVHGQFMLTPPVKWYVAWSGLGQVANSFGYEANDAHAISTLKAMGISYHSQEAENYWAKEYLMAWRDHPYHVISTILYRFREILGRMDTHELEVPRIATILYGAMAILTPILLFFMVKAKRFSDAFLIALPMLYAIVSLGFIYVERRYVRYAGITYLMAFSIVLGIVIDQITLLRQRRHVGAAVGRDIVSARDDV